MTDEQHMQKARDIVDEACLGETFAKNGVIAALTNTIASALSEAYRSGVEDAAKDAEQSGEKNTGDDEWDAGYRAAAEAIAGQIRKRK